jgi:hypothetical protein
MAGWAVLSLALLAGCNGDDDASGATKNAPLFEFNASENGGRTVRWPNLPIRVYLGNGVAQANEVIVWTGATGGAVTFTFVGSGGAANITFATGIDDPGTCGITDILIDGDHIVDSNIRVNASLYRSAGCVRTVTHEAAHGVGFLGHTNDGGLMDDDGGNGAITPLVAGVLRDLYILPPGSLVEAQLKQFGLQRPARKKIVSFTYPVRP